MDLILKRTDYLSFGIFGQLSNEDGSFLLQTLEHAYAVQPDGFQGAQTYAPKVPIGQYECILGQHQLENMPAPFNTYEITNVPSHSDILFHVGNTNNDSAGCVLLGIERVNNYIVESQVAFNKFMEIQNNLQSFNLTVS